MGHLRGQIHSSALPSSYFAPFHTFPPWLRLGPRRRVGSTSGPVRPLRHPRLRIHPVPLRSNLPTLVDSPRDHLSMNDEK